MKQEGITVYDLLIQNSMIVDGTGSPAYRADLAIANGKIAAIAPKIPAETAREVLDAAGLVTAPGFIDIHSHSDAALLLHDRCESRIYQGVTTEVSGQCGSTIYPCPDAHLDRLQQFAGRETAAYASVSYADFLKKFEENRKQMATNQISLIGHGALRCGVMGYENRKATPEELSEMRRLLARDLEAGAWGLSLGLGYTPGVSSDREELCSLGEIVARHDGIVTSHMRNQGLGTPQSLDEMFEIYRSSGAHVHVSHFKASGKAAWGHAQEYIDIVHDAQKKGIAVTADVYPYLAASSGITNSFPKWSIQGGKEVAVAMLKDPARRGKLMEELEKTFAAKEDGEALYVVTTNGAYPPADGKNIWQLSRALGCSMAEAAARVAVETNAGATCISFAMCESDVDLMLSQNDFAIGSDGSCLPLSPDENKGKPHPRNFGTFPRFLRLCREKGLCSLEIAVHRITGLSASIMGLTDRGILREGLVADLTLFRADEITDRATYEDPFQKPQGVYHVLMDGRFALRDGLQTPLLLGKFLLKK